MKKPIVAIDGPVGVGKSSVAKKLSQRLHFLYIDTGAMYRTIAYKAQQHNLDLEDETALAALTQNTRIELVEQDDGLHVLCDGSDISQEIRLPEISKAVSSVANHVKVRDQLVAQQRRMGEAGGVVMEGRDIGTVVFPNAEIKLFLDGDPEVRACRRFDQLTASGKEVTFEQTLADLHERDRKDRERPVGALKQAEDAIVVDTTPYDENGVINKLYEIVTTHPTYLS
jgi:cytidylate kinase